MKLEINFLNGTTFWRDLVTRNGEIATGVLTNADFLSRVRTWPDFFFAHDTPFQVAEKLASAGTVSISVKFYSNAFSRAIAKERRGLIRFNTAKRKYGAGSPGNIAHEAMHALGYHHRGNKRKGNENTVPYRIGRWVEEAAHVVDLSIVRTV